MTDPIDTARTTIERRRNQQPANQFYAYAAHEMARIDLTLATGGAPDRTFYQTLTHGLGLMCARELEATDPEFCETIYAMLESIRLRAGC